MKAEIHKAVPGAMGCQPAGPKRLKELAARAEDHWMEKKLDGFRLIVVCDPEEGIRGYSRAKRDQLMESKLPHVVRALGMALPDATRVTVVDGELTTHDDDWAHVSSVMKSLPERARLLQGINVDGEPLLVTPEGAKELQFRAFDVLFWDGDDVRPSALRTRRRFIDEELVPGQAETTSPLTKTKVHDLDLEKIDAWMDEGAEGAIVKRKASVYSSGAKPRGDWWKAKIEFTADVVCIGFSEGREGKGVRRMTDTFGAIVFAQYRDSPCPVCSGIEGVDVSDCPGCFGVGKYLERRGRASGMPDVLRFGVYDKLNGIDNRQDYLGKVFTITHRGIQNPGFRHPQFLGWRDDKPLDECTWDEKPW